MRKILNKIFSKRQKRKNEMHGLIQKSHSPIAKSIEMKDAKISYLSLVDKPANKVKFLVKKDESGNPEFEMSAKIIKSEKHEILGVVYEPLKKDAHDNFMTAEEIKKAADWFNKNGKGVDMQHGEDMVDGVKISKSWVLEDDTEIEGTIYKAGTWLAKAEITNEEIWNKIEKGLITGWSMGGSGTYVMEDVNIEELTTQVEKSVFTKIGEALGIIEKSEPIAKGAFKEKFKDASKRRNFWCAFDTLQSVLYPYDTNTLESDATVIKEALSEFSEVIQTILTSSDSISIFKAFTLEKELVIAKSGKSISTKNKKKLENILTEVTDLLNVDEPQVNEEEEVMKAEEVKQIVQEVIKSMNETNQSGEVIKKESNHQETQTNSESKTEDVIAKAVKAAMEPVMKSLGIEPEKELTQEEIIANSVADAVNKAMEPIYKSRGISKSLSTEGLTQPQNNNEEGYMGYFK